MLTLTYLQEGILTLTNLEERILTLTLYIPGGS